MAAIGKVARCAKQISMISRKHRHYFRCAGSVRYLSSVVERKETSSDLYPPIKPRFPPGTWDKDLLDMEDGGVAMSWHIYEQGQELLKIPKLKDRLEKLAGDKDHYQYRVEPFELSVANFEYKQYITKTHLVKNFNHLDETIYSSINCDAEYEALKPLLMDAIAQEHAYHYIHRIENGRMKEMYQSQLRNSFLLNQIMQTIIGYLGGAHDHLLHSQIDRDVRLKTFWKRTGFIDEDMGGKGKWHGKFNMQYQGEATCQVRTEFPLPAFLPHNDALCTANTYQKIEFGPAQCGQVAIVGRKTTMSGHWVGDPCEFGLLSVHQMPPVAALQRARLGDEVVEQQTLLYGMMTSFASCLAQAYNQGFTEYHELTYPFTTQAMVLDEQGKEATFIGYQLNTMQYDKDDEANPLQNICWASRPMQLFEGVENGQVIGFNDNVFKRLLKMFLVKLGKKGDHLRPNLPDDPSPSLQQAHINLIGEEPLPFRKLGRFEYPRNSIYH